MSGWIPRDASFCPAFPTSITTQSRTKPSKPAWARSSLPPRKWTLLPASADGHGAVVLLDAWYNSQQRKNAAGQTESFHYKWTDWSDSGYSLFAHMLRSAGLATQTLPAAPTPESLASAAYYAHRLPGYPGEESKSALHDQCRRRCHRRLGPARRRPHPHGKRSAQRRHSNT